MAILDKSKNNFIIDRDESKYLGLKLPLVLDSGEEASTKTTLEAVKQNVLNLLNTEMGERIMQPTFGTDLYQILFEPMTEMLVDDGADVIREAVKEWLPYVNLDEVKVDLSPDNVDRNEYHVSLKFSLIYEPDRFDNLTFNFIGAPK